MNKLWISLCLVWLLVAGAGAWVLSNYQASPGSLGPTPAQWPLGSTLKLKNHKLALIMFAHPRCPCTRASMEELNRIVAHCGDKMDVHVVFMQPDNVPKEWTQTSLWNSATGIPGVQTHVDAGCREAKRFGAESSGYVLLYDAHGKLLFHGGITSARGHAGDNAGQSAIITLVNGGSAGLDQTPVFGCSLTEPM